MNLRLGFKRFYLNSIASSALFSSRARRLLLRVYGHEVSNMKSNCFIGEGPGHIKMGKGSFCNCNCLFDCADDVLIGDNCRIAYNVSFVNSSHEIGPHDRRGGEDFAKKIIIKNGCWVGANSVILPGVIIEAGCIIAAGSIVTDNCEPDGLYGGIPAKRIKDLK